MAKRMAVGIGAGLTALVAAAVLMGPVAHGDGTDEKPTMKADSQVEKEVERKVDRRIRIVSRGASYLGVRLEDVDSEDVTRLRLPEEKGALVRKVEDDSPAAKAGIKADDVIVRYHGEGVLGASQLARLVRETPRGRVVPVEVVRGGAVQKLSVTPSGDGRTAWRFDGSLPEWDIEIPEMAIAPIAPVPPVPPVAPAPPLPPSAFERWGKWGKRALLDDFAWFGRGPRRLGIEFQEVSGQLAKYFKVAGDSGVLVTSVEDDGPAAKAGLRSGDILLEFDGRTIRDAEDLQRAVAKAVGGKELSMSVQREGRSLELKVTLADERREDRGEAREETET